MAAATGMPSRRGGAASRAVTYRAEFCGFAPGFAYLAGLDPSPRHCRGATRHAPPFRPARSPIADRVHGGVPDGLARRVAPARAHRRGAVGRATGRPGDAPARHARALPPGTRVAGATPTGTASAAPRRRHVDDGALEVIAAGWSTSVQDGGRPGFAHLGVSPSGAVDGSRRRALNRLLGNPPAAAVVETTGGLVAAAQLRRRWSPSRAVATVTTPRARRRARGSIRVPASCGPPWPSAAASPRRRRSARAAGTASPASGRRRPAVGTVLATGADPRRPIDRGARTARADVRTSRAARRTAARLVRRRRVVDARHGVVAGHRRGIASRRAPPRSAARTRRRPAGERARLARAWFDGAMQVPPDGQPVVVLADHPTTGGYPVVAVVDDRAVDELARLGPGSPVRFRRPRRSDPFANAGRDSVPNMERRIYGLENEYGVTCTLRGQRRLSPDEVARYLFRRVVSLGPQLQRVPPERRPPLPRRRLPPRVRHARVRLAVRPRRARQGRASGSSRASCESAEQRLAEEAIRGTIYLFKNNTDSAGNSYGCHENYLTSRATTSATTPRC